MLVSKSTFPIGSPFTITAGSLGATTVDRSSTASTDRGFSVKVIPHSKQCQVPKCEGQPVSLMTVGVVMNIFCVHSLLMDPLMN